MGVDSGAIATYLGLLGGCFAFIAGMVYKFGKLMARFETAMSEMTEWEKSIHHLNAIPDIKQALEVLGDGLKRHTSDISHLRERQARIEGQMGIPRSNPSIHEE